MAEIKIDDADTGQEEEKKSNGADVNTDPETEEAAKTEETSGDADQAAADKAKTGDDSKEEKPGETKDEKGNHPEAADTKKEVKEDTDTKDADSGKKKSFFTKKKEDKELADLKEKNASLTDQLRRQLAEFDNYRKRTDKEKDQMFSMGEKNVCEKILPIVDNFERGLQSLGDDRKDDPFVQGIEKVYQQMVKQLKDLGVTPIEAVGKEFDPNFHNAVMQVDSEEYESGVVAQELQKGYMFHDQVLRHSMVAVAK